MADKAGSVPKRIADFCCFRLAGYALFFHGSLAGLPAFAPRSFPISARATGVNTMHAVGCLGAAIGSSLMGAVMLGCGFAGQDLLCPGEFRLHAFVRYRARRDDVLGPGHFLAGLAIDDFQIRRFARLPMDNDRGFALGREMLVSEGMKIK
jgi:hypothetical protein